MIMEKYIFIIIYYNLQKRTIKISVTKNPRTRTRRTMTGDIIFMLTTCVYSSEC